MEELVIREGVPCRLHHLVSSTEGESSKFTCFAWSNFDVLHKALPHLDRLTSVFVCVVNACRACNSRTVVFRPTWYRRHGLHARTVVRCLDRLESAGLLSVDKKRGRSPKITLADHVSLEPKGRKRGPRTTATN